MDIAKTIQYIIIIAINKTSLALSMLQKGEIMIQAFDSRQYMLTKTFEVFHYSDSDLDNIELHHHDFFEVYFFLSGKVDYLIDSRNYHLLPGDVLLISPLELHHPQFPRGKETAYERFVLWINKSLLYSLSSPQTPLSACFDTSDPHHTNLLRLTPSQQDSIKYLMLSLISETESDAYGADLAAMSILVSLLVSFNRIAQSNPLRYEEGGGRASTLVQNVLEYINSHYDENLSVESIASHFFVSKYHLSHEFKRLIGTSVYRYVHQRRLVYAKQMMLDGMPPTVVSQHSGFKDYANFYRAFKNIYQISPKKYYDMVQEANKTGNWRTYNQDKT